MASNLKKMYTNLSKKLGSKFSIHLNKNRLEEKNLENELKELYTNLAQQMASMIPTKWNKLYYLGEVEKEEASWSSVFYFEDYETGEMKESHNIPDDYGVSREIYRNLLSELNTILLDIYACFERNGQPLWEQLSFFLTSKGEFEINYNYDVMNENDGGQMMREIVWAYETFNLKPKQGTYSARLLNRR